MLKVQDWSLILFSMLFTYICTDGLSLFFPCFFENVFKIILNIWKDYNPSGNSDLSFHVSADILNLLLLHDLFIFFHV